MKNVLILLLATSLILVIPACIIKDKVDHAQHPKMGNNKEVYTCPMHPQIINAQPGKCPICGMELLIKDLDSTLFTSVQLESLLKPTNQFVISSIPVIAVRKDQHMVEIDAIGKVEYDTRSIGNISARINGRIEKLYVRYTYQMIQKGQKIMDLYSPELLTAQQNLLFILKNDPDNNTLLQAARQKLVLLGISEGQLERIIQSGNPVFSISVYSPLSGHLHNTGSRTGDMNQQPSRPAMNEINPSTEILNLKEGMYVQKGQNLFSVYNPSKAWALLNIYTDGQSLIQVGQAVKILAETAPEKPIQGRIDFIEPFYREGSRTTSVRVYFDNSTLRLPIGSQVKGLILITPIMGYWLPKEAVISLGMDRIVFLKEVDGFKPKKITTGNVTETSIQIIDGLAQTDSVAIKAQFLIDSESFIKVKE